MLLIGIGTAGCAIARGVSRAFGDGLRYLLADTDATTRQPGEPFILIGGDRLSGQGSGGDIVSARLATEDSIQVIDEHLEGVRLAVIVTALGGGTGGGATFETVKHLSNYGISTIVFATTPFMFEGEDRQRNSRGVMTMIEECANATFLLPLDKLVQGEDNMESAMRRAIDTVSGGVTLFWRLVGKPGYIQIDAERIRHLIANAGRGRFATVTVQGQTRTADALDRIVRNELLATASAPVKAILCGVLAGEDLRLSEIGQLARGIRDAFGDKPSFELGTVNDENTFCGRLSVVVMLFESNTKSSNESVIGGVLDARKTHHNKSPLEPGPTGRGRFNNAERTIWNGEDLDIPTFTRRNVNLDF